LLKKLYAETIEGITLNYHTKMYRRINAFRALVAMLSDGKLALPFWSEFLFTDKIFPELYVDKKEYVKKITLLIIEMFPETIITVVADGAFSTKEFSQWCIDNNIRVEMRIRKNAKVFYKDEEIQINLIKSLSPRGRQIARSIHVIWHGMHVYITAHRRFDKNQNETIVYLISTFKAKPIEHVNIYQFRWNIEKFFRTAKQKLGLENCTAQKIETQKNHVAAVIFAYVLAQLQCKKLKLKNPDQAIRAFNHKKAPAFHLSVHRLDRLFHSDHV
jgi:hypothetical protein